MGCSHTIIPASEGHLFACPGSRIGSRVRWIRVYRALLDDTLEHVEALVRSSGRSASELGMPGDAIARPDLNALLDPRRELLPPPTEAAARSVT